MTCRHAGWVLAVLLPAGMAVRAAEEKPPAMSAEGKKEHDEAVKKAIEEFKKTLKDARNDNEKASAVYRLGQSERDLKIISALAPYIAGGGEMTRGEAITALKAYHKEKVAAGVLIAAAPSCKNSVTLMEKLIAAMGAVGTDAVIPALIEHLKDNDTKIAVAAAKALADVNSVAVVDPLLNTLKRLERDKDPVSVNGVVAGGERYRLVAPAVMEAIKTVTGQKMLKYEEYETWWTQNRATFKAKGDDTPKWQCPVHK